MIITSRGWYKLGHGLLPKQGLIEQYFDSHVSNPRKKKLGPQSKVLVTRKAGKIVECEATFLALLKIFIEPKIFNLTIKWIAQVMEGMGLSGCWGSSTYPSFHLQLRVLLFWSPIHTFPLLIVWRKCSSSLLVTLTRFDFSSWQYFCASSHVSCFVLTER